MSAADRFKKIVIRAALASLVRGSEIFPRESNQIQPIIDYLKNRTWYKLLDHFFMQVDPDPDAPEFLSLRYDLPSESINIEIDEISDDGNREEVDLGSLTNLIHISDTSPFNLQNTEPHVSNHLPTVGDHRYHTEIERLELPPVLLNVRPTWAKSVAKKRICLKNFASLRSIEKRQRKLSLVQNFFVTEYRV